MNSSLNCANIPANQPFLRRLAQWLIESYGQNAEEFVNVLVLLPNRRSCLALRDEFLEVTNGKATLLPKILPIGEVSTDSFFHAEPILELPPAIAPMRRQLLLTHMAMQFETARYGRAIAISDAVKLAAELARFFDEVARAGLDFSRLAEIVPESLAVHWQETLRFLEIVTQQWPKLLLEEQAMDPVMHRSLMIKTVAEMWRQLPPQYPIIAAGSTGSQPATAELLKVIAALPKGRVILSGLDTELSASAWNSVKETHPQYLLKQLTATLGASPQSVLPLTACGQQTSLRSDLIRTLFAPAEEVSKWRQSALPLAEALRGIHYAEAETLHDEARMIAIILRGVLETPEKTGALITPDRTLANMVAAHMQRFGVVLDDSSGHPLSTTLAANLMMLILDMAMARATPASLLAVLRHPLAATGIAPSLCRTFSRQLELRYLRGVRRGEGLDALAEVVHADPELSAWLKQFIQNTKRLLELFDGHHRNVSFLEFLDAVLEVAQWVASSDETSGEACLWEGEGGQALAAFFCELRVQAELIPDADILSFPSLLHTLLAQETYHARYGTHPRLRILSPMEARLQHFDTVVLASLNDGTWPQVMSADPWMSRPMRQSFGLPSREREVGQQAHDVSQLMHCEEVWLTRAQKIEGTPTVASRWLVRLKILVGGMDSLLLKQMDATSNLYHAISQLDQPEALTPIQVPAPMPPVSARPNTLNVTAIETWMRDPYMHYARHILKLRALEPLDKEPGAAEFGTVVHAAIEIFTKRWPTQLPTNFIAEMLECGRQAFATYHDRPAVLALWWPRFYMLAEWLETQEKQKRTSGVSVFAEIKGSWKFDVGNSTFTLTTRLDRIERHAGGELVIADYKTGTVPTKSDRDKGLANQLPLEALVALNGVLEGYPHTVSQVAGLEYWKLAGNSKNCEIKPCEFSLESTKRDLLNWLQRYSNPETSYRAQTNPALLPPYNDYAHLTRRQEWGDT